MAEINVANDEIRTIREAMREMGALLDQLERRDVDKIVLVSRGKMRGVILSVEVYAAMQKGFQEWWSREYREATERRAEEGS